MVLGYRQIARIDFGDIHAPVIGNTSLRMLLILKMALNLSIKSIDIEAAFLEGPLNENNYIQLPEGLKIVEKVKEDQIGKMNKAAYGLVQATRNFYKTITDYITSELNFEKSKAEPCLLKGNGVFIGLYLDDLILIGKKEKNEQFVQNIKK